MNELDQKILQIREANNENDINDIIEQYTPFIIKIVSNVKNAYVEVQNDEELSIGLMAFYEAISKYDVEKGKFLSFAAIVIESRVKSYIQQEKKHFHHDLDGIEETSDHHESIEDHYELLQEIETLESFLEKFGISFDQLADLSPKHYDTREKAVDLSVKTSKESDLVKFMYTKWRLPITKIAERFFVSIKIIKRSKAFIIACVIIITKKLDNLKTWLNYE